MCLALQATAIVSRAELWPFSPYAMYDELVSNDVRWVRLAAVTDQGEIEIRSDATTLPFGSARLALALEPIFTRGDSIDVQRALGSVASLIERALRDDASNARVLLRALRLYRVEWTVDRKLRNVRRPDRVTLLAEFVVAR